MILNGNQIYTLQCKEPRHNMLIAGNNYQEIMSEAMVLCKATGETVNIYCHGTASVMGNVTPEFLASIA